MNWLRARDRSFAHEKPRMLQRCPVLLIYGMLACSLIEIAGCNSAQVIRANIQRTAQNGGRPQPRPWPVHPYAPATSHSPNANVPRDRPMELDDQANDEADNEIIQTAAQWPSNAYPVRVGQVARGGGVITGRVVDPNGRPQPFISIIASPTLRPGGRRAETMTNQHGNFTLLGLEPGQRYLILATATRSASALIGRVSAIAPQQGVVIGVSRPHTADRRVEPRSGVQSEAGHPARLAAPAENAVARRFHADNPFGQSSDTNAGTTHVPGPASPRQAATSPKQPVGRTPASPSPTMETPQKQTREQAAQMNRLPSPWDMPAPPTRKTTSTAPRTAASTAAHVRSAEPANTTSDTGWRRVGTEHTPQSPATLDAQPEGSAIRGHGGFSLLDATPPAKPARLAADANPTPDSRLSTATTHATNSSRPIEVDANARPDRPRSALTPANVPLESKPDSLIASPRDPIRHDGPMCQMDGRRLVDFQLNDVDGRPVSFGTINSRLVLIDFWTTWCGPCLKAIPHLVNLQKRYGEQGLQVVGIACEQGHASDRVARVARTRSQLQASGMHIAYPLLIDAGDDDKLLLRDHFRIDQYPTLILLDKTGKVLWRNEGPDHADLAQLENLLKNQLNAATIGYN